jgi:hypothetical protein
MNLGAAYDTLLALEQEAFHAGHFEVGYHALEAAVHCAYGRRDPAGLAAVARLAEGRRDWIDEYRPEHPLSTRHAAGHGGRGAFTALASMVHALLAALHAEGARMRASEMVLPRPEGWVGPMQGER